MGAPAVTKRISEASPRSKARIAGAVYLAYFLTAIFAEAVVGRGRHVAYVGVNLVAYALYIAVTLLFFYMFKPVNRRLSSLAALFSLAGCANELVGLFFISLPTKSTRWYFSGPIAC